MKGPPRPPAPARGLAPIYGEVYALPKPRHAPAKAVKAPQRKDPFSWSDVGKVVVIAVVLMAVYAAGILTGFVLDLAN